jgi:hypothetical protein
MDDILTQLTPDQALEVVRRLHNRDGNIQRAVLEEARNVLEAVDRDEIAEEVFLVLDLIDVQDLWDASGASRDGYISPDEAAVEMMENELEPFFDQVRRYHKLRMFPQEHIYCMGVLQGIYRFGQESETEFKEWAVDVPQECFGGLLNEWRKGCQSSIATTEMDEFIRDSCPNWAKYVLGDDDRTMS